MKLVGLGSVIAGGTIMLLVGCGSSEDPIEEAPGGREGATSYGADGTPIGGGTEPGTSVGGSRCSGSADDPAAAATISGYMDKLPYKAPTGEARAKITDAIIKTCTAFGPPPSKNPGWERTHCFAHLVSAILKESSYDTELSVTDSYAQRAIGSQKANDPTVGLLQIRFSSTVRDFSQEGALESLSCIGCTFPSSLATHNKEAGDSPYWAVSGPTENASLMKSVACNVGLGAWYYYVNATGNGKTTAPTYLSSYCSGKGTAANLVIGLLSHLEGPERGKGNIADMTAVNALKQSDNNAYQYVTAIKTQFDGMIGPVSGTHPFFVKLGPDATQYCR